MPTYGTNFTNYGWGEEGRGKWFTTDGPMVNRGQLDPWHRKREAQQWGEVIGMFYKAMLGGAAAGKAGAGGELNWFEKAMKANTGGAETFGAGAGNVMMGQMFGAQPFGQGDEGKGHLGGGMEGALASAAFAGGDEGFGSGPPTPPDPAAVQAKQSRESAADEDRAQVDLSGNEGHMDLVRLLLQSLGVGDVASLLQPNGPPPGAM